MRERAPCAASGSLVAEYRSVDRCRLTTLRPAVDVQLVTGQEVSRRFSVGAVCYVIRRKTSAMLLSDQNLKYGTST